jgi:hypothetical protein
MIDPALVYLHCKMRGRSAKRSAPRSSKSGYSVLIKTSRRGTLPANFQVPATAQAAEVALALRERGAGFRIAFGSIRRRESGSRMSSTGGVLRKRLPTN